MEATKKEPYQSIIEDYEESDFEKSRRTLLNLYHSYNQTHAGYMIALIIGSLTLASRLDAFLQDTLWIVFLVLMIGVAFGFLFVILRLQFWAMMAAFTTGITRTETISLFNRYNSEYNKSHYTEKPPCPKVIEMGVLMEIYEKTETRILDLPRRWAFKCARLNFEKVKQ
jgi:hypothetical protein